MVRSNQILDLAPHIGVVKSSFRFDLKGPRVSSPTMGTLHPASDARMSLQNNTTGNILRKVTGFELDASDAIDVNLAADRVHIRMVLEDGTEWPLGRFLFASDDKTITTGGEPFQTTLFDPGFILDQARLLAFGGRRGENVIDLIVHLAEEVGFDEDEIIVEHNSDKIIKDDISWPSGTSRYRMMKELAQLAGYFTPYFNNDGYLVIRPAVSVVHTGDTLTYPLNDHCRIINGTYTKAPNLLQAPNVYLAINNGSQDGEIVGRYEVPADLPHSVANRGYEVVSVVKTQGISSTQSADDIAKAAANQDPRNFEQVQFESPPDPRHDTFDTVAVGSDVYIEIDWAMELTSGGSHRHNLRKVLSEEGG